MNNFEETKKNVAKKINEFREQKGMTIEDLAGDVGITTTALANILKGNANMKTSTLVAVCVALEVFPGELLPKPSFFSEWEDRINKMEHQFEMVSTGSLEKVFDVVLAALDAFVKTKVSGGYVVQMRIEKQKEGTQASAIQEDKKYIAGRIDMIRAHKEISIKGLASDAGMSEGAIDNILRGKSDMRMSSLIDLCKALAVFPEEVLPQLVFLSKGTKRFGSVKNKLLAVPSNLKETAFTVVAAILDEYTK